MIASPNSRPPATNDPRERSPTTPGSEDVVRLHDLAASDAPCCQRFRALYASAQSAIVAKGGVPVHFVSPESPAE